MAKSVPSGYTRFLERLLAEIPRLAERQPELGQRLQGARILASGYQVFVPHPLTSTLRWSFRQNRKTGSHESKTFNIECVPRRTHTLSPSVVEQAWRESGLSGEVGFDGSEFFFQIAWGYGNETDNLVHNEHLASTLRQWAFDAIAVAIRLVEALGSTVDFQPARQTGPATASSVLPRRHLSLSSEGLLEDLIVEQWDEIDFGADLEYVGRQLRCEDIGIIDILARDRQTRGYVVIELKRHQGDDETFGQLCRYMGWINENKDQPEGVPIAGIIIVAEVTPKLKSAASTNPNVRLMRYSVKISLSIQS